LNRFFWVQCLSEGVQEGNRGGELPERKFQDESNYRAVVNNDRIITRLTEGGYALKRRLVNQM